MTRALRRWVVSLYAPVDAASLAVFRIVFGAAVAWETVRYLLSGWVNAYYIQPALHFTYLYLDFVRPWPGQWMQVHFWVMAGLALLVAAGCCYRITSVLLFLAYTYVFLLEQAVYMNHHYLICLLAFLLMFMPAERAFSVDHWRHPERPRTVPQWTVWILRFQLVLVYVYGGIAKLNADWLQGEPMRSLMVERIGDWPRLGPAVPIDLVALVIAWGGMIADFLIPLLLLWPRLVAAGLAMALVFHGLNAAVLHIGVFSYLMLGAITIFLPPDWPRRRWRDLLRWQPAAPSAAPVRLTKGVLAWALLLHLYVVAQLLTPMRHWLYAGDVAWTEEGHRFAWRMMLRHKRSTVLLTAVDPATGRIWSIDPAQDLTPRQLAKLHTFPDILLQYVHHHSRRLQHEEGVLDPVITARWMCSLNGRPPQLLADPTANLAAEPRSLRGANWLLPLDGRRGETPEEQAPLPVRPDY